MLWRDGQGGQRTAGSEPLVRAVEAGDISWYAVPTVTKLLLPIGGIMRCMAATTARDAGRHRARRNPGIRARSTKRK
jgi:hypothetical protein